MLLLLAACSLPPTDALVAAPPAAAPRVPRHRGRKSETFTVDCAGGGQYLTIMEAVREADSGDVVEVAPCTYVEQVDFRGRALRIVATGGPSVTTIQGPGDIPAVRVHRGEGPGTVLEGFTVTGGGGPLEAAIEEQFSMLTLKDLVVTGNGGTYTVYARSGLLTLDGVTIEATNTASDGVVIHGRRGEVVVKDSDIACGTTERGYVMEHGAGFIDGSTFRCDGARAIEMFHGNGRIQRTVVDGLLHVENETNSDEPTTVEGSVLLDGMYAYYALVHLKNVVAIGGVRGDYVSLSLTSSVVTGAACGMQLAGSTASVSYTDFWDNTQDACGGTDPVGRNGNVDVDPQFVGAGDYQLSAASPAIDAGSTDDADRDPDGSRGDMGAYGGPFSLGGGW